MKSIIYVLMAMTMIGTAVAQDRREVKQQIRDLSYRIEQDAPYSDADLADLREAKSLMRDALSLINKTGGGNSQVYKECMNYAYEKYKREYSNSDALQRAQTKCKSVADMDVLKFLFEKHFRTTTNGGAMDLSTSQADRRTKGRLELIEFAYQKHFRVHDSSSAATKAVKNIQSLRKNRGSLACFNQYYKIHYRSYDSSVAMDKTIETCSNL